MKTIQVSSHESVGCNLRTDFFIKTSTFFISVVKRKFLVKFPPYLEKNSKKNENRKKPATIQQ